MRFTVLADGHRHKVQAMASEYSHVLVWATVLRVIDPRSGGGNPCKVLGIKVRWALLGFVGPFILKKF
jgi:hypothetical protein